MMFGQNNNTTITAIGAICEAIGSYKRTNYKIKWNFESCMAQVESTLRRYKLHTDINIDLGIKLVREGLDCSYSGM